MRNVLKKIKGFTLIELIIVIIVIGILAAVAVPKFFDLETTAKTNALARVVAQIESASAVNLAHSKSGVSGSQAVLSTSTCATVIPLLLANGAMPTGYTTTGTVSATSGASTGTCEITQTNGGATSDATLFLTTDAA